MVEQTRQNGTRQNGSAVGYLRVSTESQADGFGLDVQRDTVERYCQEQGMTLDSVWHDELSGTAPLEDRAGLAEALSRLNVIGQQGPVTLVIPRLDRLARDLVVQETLLREVWQSGAEVASCAQGEAQLRDDPDDPSRQLIRQVLGAVSQYERAIITLRLKRGRAAKAARGGFATGSPPYGWQADGSGELAVDDDEQQVIGEIVMMRRDGMALADIAERLNRQQIPTKRPGGRWYASTVKRVLDRAGRDVVPAGHDDPEMPAVG